MESNINNHRPLMLADTSSKDTVNKVLFLVKGLKHCEPINGNLLFRIIGIITNSNTVLR